MSHLNERKERNCLNCNAQLHGKYCHICGQENIEPKESFWHLLTHFFQDITHFDGKFFSSLKYLIFKPGFLTREYMMGRRASYLNPIRIYIFTSAFFFLIFFSFYQQQEAIVNTSSTTLLTDLKKSKVTLAEKLQKNLSPEEKKEIEVEIKNTEDDIAMLEKDSTATDKLKTANYSFNVISFKSDDEKRLYKTLKEYDSMQKTLSKNKRDGFIVGRLERQNLYLKEKYNNDSRKIFKSIFENFIHRFPQMLFVSLPLFAFILWLLYIRRKNFFYVNHAIYAVHLYCASFIFILTGLWLSSIFSWFGKDFPKWIITLFTLSSIFYLYKAQRNFYGQSRTKTIFKFILLMLASLIIMVILFAVFFIFSTFSA